MFTGNRLYLAAIATLMVMLLFASFMLELNTEARIANITALATAQSRKADMAMYVRLIVDAESSQRGYLLTQDETYLEPYETSREQATELLDRIVKSYQFADDAGDRGKAIQDDLYKLRELSTAKLDELAASLVLNASNSPEAAIELVRTNVGRRTMDHLRIIATELDKFEDEHTAAALQEWQGGVFVSRAMVAGGTVLNLALLAYAAFLLNRDLRSREGVRLEQEQHRRELEALVQVRTAEMSALSSHLQNVAEREKAAIARELHDELGGIMVAAKMDVAWLEKRLSHADDELKIRWTRLRKLLDDGVDMKRRVVETLRPTLLDNMGLVPAVQWLYAETCARGGLECTESYPAETLELDNEAAIAVFRVIQESLVNIIKHAKASAVSLTMAVEDDALKICIRDNGIGMPLKPRPRRSQGLASMRHRVNSFGGTWRIASPTGGGTLIEISLPLDRIIPSAAVATDEA
jgi:signal transduction histidine kinase